jgi:hypothetical protein
MNKENAWSEPEKERLRQFWNVDGLGPAEIGRRMGRSPNSITSMRDRMGLTPRPSPIGRVSAKPPLVIPLNSNRRHGIPKAAASTLPPLGSLVD